MALGASAGSKIYIGPTTAAATASAYAALTWVEIKPVETIGEFGDSSTPVNFTALGDSRVRKSKGSRDAGDVSVVCGRDPLDLGQIAVKAAEKTKFAYAIKVVLEDSADANDTDTVFYFHALVMQARTGIGSVNDITKLPINLAITNEPIEVASVAVS